MRFSPKLSLLSLALISTLAITGCDKNTPTEQDDNVTDTASATNNSEAATANNATGSTDATSTPATTTSDTVTNEEDLTLAKLTTESLDNMLFIPLIESGELTDEQVTCLEARDKNLGVAESQAFYKSKFTAAELKELNDFYSSDIGKKMLVFGNEQLQAQNGIPVKNPAPEPTEAEFLQMQEFLQSPTGVKYVQLNEQEGEGSMYAMLDPIVKAELDRCKIEGVM